MGGRSGSMVEGGRIGKEIRPTGLMSEDLSGSEDFGGGGEGGTRVERADRSDGGGTGGGATTGRLAGLGSGYREGTSDLTGNLMGGSHLISGRHGGGGGGGRGMRIEGGGARNRSSGGIDWVRWRDFEEVGGRRRGWMMGGGWWGMVEESGRR